MESRVNQLREILKDRELKNREILEDMEIQLVLKMGQIECELYGDPRELSNAVLVPFSIINHANTAIIRAGRKKLNAMRQTVLIRRTIIWQEWRHKCMQITLRDMQEELKVLRGVKVTREIQTYLMNDPPNISPEKKKKFSNRVLNSTKMVKLRFQQLLIVMVSDHSDKNPTHNFSIVNEKIVDFLLMKSSYLQKPHFQLHLGHPV